MSTRRASITLLVCVALAPVGACAQVVIDEIMYDPSGADSGHEWVELMNIGSTSTDLSDWRLSEGGTNHKLTVARGNVFIQPNSYAVIADNATDFIADHPGFAGTLFDSAFSLGNASGETVALKDAAGTGRDSVSYQSAWGAGGNGDSLQLVAGTWRASAPTPGLANIYVPPAPKAPAVPAVSHAASSAKPASKVASVASSSASFVKTSSSTGAAALPGNADSSPGNDSDVRWYALLASVIVLGIAALFIGGRTKAPGASGYAIIEEKDEV